MKSKKRENADREKDLAYLMKHFVGVISTWEEFYDYLDNCMENVRGTMHPIVMIDTMTTMYNMFTAMREMPEEGDIKVLLERTAYLMVYAETTSGVPRLLSGRTLGLDQRLGILNMEVETLLSGADTTNVHVLH